MAISSILLPIDGTDETRSLLQTAFGFARQFKSHIDVIHVKLDPKDMVPLLGEGMSVAMIEDMIDLAERESAKRSENAKKLFDEAVSENEVNIVGAPSNGGFSARWILENGREDEILSRYSRLTDIICVPRPQKSVDVSSNLKLHTAIFESGRAVLMLPPLFKSMIGSRIVISWNGSVQSARAVRAAMEILLAADSVHIFTVQNDQTTNSSIPGLQDYLGWHGVNCDTKYISGAPSVVGPKLLEEFANLNADLLVMGAYTHSRMRQLILGGVTRHIMENTEHPVFMAH